MQLNAQETARALGVSRQMLNRYLRAGMPRGDDKRYDLATVQRWLKDQELGKPSVDGSTARTELMIAQRVKIELETAKMRRELLPAADVRQAVQAIAATVAGQLDALPPRVAPQIVGAASITTVIGALRFELHAVRIAIADEIEALELGV